MKARLRLAEPGASEPRCRAGRRASKPARGKVAADTPLRLEIGLNRRAQRCLETAGAAGLPVELTIMARRGRTLVVRRTEAHVWR
jgi:hypothetical protein